MTAPIATFSFTTTDIPAFVYVARNDDDEVVYVGVTGSLVSRMAAHAKADLWWSQAASISVEVWPSREAANVREKTLIDQFRAPDNRFEVRQRGWAEKRREREEIIIEMRKGGHLLKDIARQLGIDHNRVAGMVGQLRAAGRL